MIGKIHYTAFCIVHPTNSFSSREIHQEGSGNNNGCSNGAICENTLSNTGTIRQSKDSAIHQQSNANNGCSGIATSCTNSGSQKASIS